MTTITLPDHISFEEIALEWCEDCKSQRAVQFILLSVGFFEFSVAGDKSFNYVEGELIAFFVPYTRTLSIKNSEKFQPILDFIKERSNSNNEITIPDHISLERIATIWCHKGERNSVLHSGRSWVFVQFNDDSYKIAAESSSNSRTLKVYPEFVPSASAFMDHVVFFIEERSHG